MEHKSKELLDAVAAISEKVDAQEAAYETARQFIHVIGGDRCVLFKWDADKKTMNLWAENDHAGPDQNHPAYLSYPIEGFPEAVKAFDTLQPVQINIENDHIDENEKMKLERMGARSLLIQPLCIQNELIGFVEVFSITEPQEFSEEEISNSKSLAYHASIALERSILLEDITQRAAELEVVRQVSLSLTGNLDTEKILYNILNSALRLSKDAMDAHVFIYKDKILEFGAALWSDGRRGEPHSNPREGGITYSVARSGKMIVVPDVQKDKLFKGQNWTGAIIGLPLKSGDQVVGVMNIAYKNPRPFTENDLRVLQLLAGHAGIAIQRAILLEESEQRAAELEAVRLASLSLNSSLQLQEVLQAILESAMGISKDAQNANLFLFQQDTLVFQAALWSDGRKETSRPFAEPRQDGLTYTVARSGELITIPDMQDHEIYQGVAKQKGWKGAIIGLPLKRAGEVIGVMNIAYQNPRAFSQDDLRALQLLADHAAIAIENARLHNLVSAQALTDPLTGLPNRRAFDQRVIEEINRSKRYEHIFALLMLDLNNFKAINDTYGHPAGDQALQSIAKLLKTSIRETDFIGRIGGDEIAVILPETDLEHAEQIGTKLSQVISDYDFVWKESDKPMRVSLSFGISMYPQNGQDAKTLYQVSDTNLYAKKRKRKR